MKTRQEVDFLKRAWLKDPSWDLWDHDTAEGDYSEYTDELGEFQQEHRNMWELDRLRDIVERCNHIGCSPRMLEHVDKLSAEIDGLREELLE